MKPLKILVHVIFYNFDAQLQSPHQVYHQPIKSGGWMVRKNKRSSMRRMLFSKTHDDKKNSSAWEPRYVWPIGATFYPLPNHMDLVEAGTLAKGQNPESPEPAGKLNDRNPKWGEGLVRKKLCIMVDGPEKYNSTNNLRTPRLVAGMHWPRSLPVAGTPKMGPKRRKDETETSLGSEEAKTMPKRVREDTAKPAARHPHGDQYACVHA